MDLLNLPSFPCKIKEVKGKPYIFDSIRRKFILLTPEEWVRQHFIHLLLNHYNYPRALFAVESGMVYNTMAKRSDILVLSATGTPFLLVECKAPGIRIGPAVFNQIARYHFTLRPQYLAVTNGKEHFCFTVQANGEVVFLQDFPKYR